MKHLPSPPPPWLVCVGRAEMLRVVSLITASPPSGARRELLPAFTPLDSELLLKLLRLEIKVFASFTLLSKVLSTKHQLCS